MKGRPWALARARRADGARVRGRRRGARALRRRARAARPGGGRRSSGPAPSCCLGERLRRGGRRADARAAVAGRPRRVRRARRGAVGRAGERRAQGDRRDRPAARRVIAGPADAAGAADRADAGRGGDDAGGRGGAVPQPEDGRVPPAPRLPQARRELPRRAGGGAPGRRGRPGASDPARLRARFQHEVERRLGREPDAAEAGRLEHAPQPRLARLGAEREADLLAASSGCRAGSRTRSRRGRPG